MVLCWTRNVAVGVGGGLDVLNPVSSPAVKSGSRMRSIVRFLLLQRYNVKEHQDLFSTTVFISFISMVTNQPSSESEGKYIPWQHIL